MMVMTTTMIITCVCVCADGHGGDDGVSLGEGVLCFIDGDA